MAAAPARTGAAPGAAPALKAEPANIAGAASACRHRAVLQDRARYVPAIAAGVVEALTAGGAGVLSANRAQVRVQQGVAWSTAAKTGLTVAALGATAYARVLDRG